MPVIIKPRRGLSVDVVRADPKVQLGEVVYLTDKEALGVGNDKGEVVGLTQIVKGPDDGLYAKIEGMSEYIPLSIKAY